MEKPFVSLNDKIEYIDSELNQHGLNEFLHDLRLATENIIEYRFSAKSFKKVGFMEKIMQDASNDLNQKLLDFIDSTDPIIPIHNSNSNSLQHRLIRIKKFDITDSFNALYVVRENQAQKKQKIFLLDKPYYDLATKIVELSVDMTA